MLGSNYEYAPCALARVEVLCAALLDHPVQIAVLSDLAYEDRDDEFGEISILTTDPDVELVEAWCDVRADEHDP